MANDETKKILSPPTTSQTSPNSNDDKVTPITKQEQASILFHSCSNQEICVTLESVLKSFNTAISEEQAWAVLYNTLKIYRAQLSQRQEGHKFRNLPVPLDACHINLHKDGTIHFNFCETGKSRNCF